MAERHPRKALVIALRVAQRMGAAPNRTGQVIPHHQSRDHMRRLIGMPAEIGFICSAAHLQHERQRQQDAEYAKRDQMRPCAGRGYPLSCA